MHKEAPLLEVRSLKTHFRTFDGIAQAVNDVSFTLDKGETLGIVGESGCGKSVTARSIMQLIQEPPGKIEGEIFFDGLNLLQLAKKQIKAIRGKRIRSAPDLCRAGPQPDLSPRARGKISVDRRDRAETVHSHPHTVQDIAMDTGNRTGALWRDPSSYGRRLRD